MTYEYNIVFVFWIQNSTTYLLTRLPHAGLYNDNGRQIELFHMKWFVDRLTGPMLKFLWNARVWC